MNPLVHTALSVWQILDSHCCLWSCFWPNLIQFLTEIPRWIRFIACHFRGCQSALWPEVSPTFRERATRFVICLGSFAQKRLCFIDPGSEGKSELFYQPFKRMTQLCAQQVRIFCGYVMWENPQGRVELAADCPRWSWQCSSMHCADKGSLCQQVGHTWLLPGWRLKEAKERPLLDFKI